MLTGLCALIFAQSHGFVLTDIPLPVHLDKLLHFVCFALLAVLFYRAYHTLPFGTSVSILFLLSVVSAIGYGIGDELHQRFIPLRVADKWDILADGAGALFGLAFYLLWRHRRGRRQPLRPADHCRS
jgi:VanZ family protein